jgi:four helix bundle protein
VRCANENAVRSGDEPIPKKNYRDLRVWQAAIDLVTRIYEVTRALPNEERYALGDQMRRAAISIPANIAEGQARRHSKEFLQHLSIAKGSLAELHTLLTVAERLKYLSADELARLENELSWIRRPLEGLMSSLRNPS